MIKRSMVLATGFLAVACAEAPTAPDLERGVGSPAAFAARQTTPSAKVRARSGNDLIEMQVRVGRGETETVLGSFDAQLSNRGTRASGRIRTEWGTTRGSRTTGIVVEIQISDVSVSNSGAVLFSGKGTLTDQATGRVEQFPVTGSATQSAGNPDCVIFDIVGSGSMGITVDVPGRFDLKLPG